MERKRDRVGSWRGRADGGEANEDRTANVLNDVRDVGSTHCFDAFCDKDDESGKRRKLRGENHHMSHSKIQSEIIR